MDIEKVALEAIKQKIEEIFKKVQVKSSLEGREIVIRISIPNEIMQIQPELRISTPLDNRINCGDLDAQAQLAADELLGTK